MFARKIPEQSIKKQQKLPLIWIIGIRPAVRMALAPDRSVQIPVHHCMIGSGRSILLWKENTDGVNLCTYVKPSQVLDDKSISHPTENVKILRGFSRNLFPYTVKLIAAGNVNRSTEETNKLSKAHVECIVETNENSKKRNKRSHMC